MYGYCPALILQYSLYKRNIDGMLISLRNTTDAVREALAMLSRESSTPEVCAALPCPSSKQTSYLLSSEFQARF